jgi:hypothetical protein
MGAQVYQQIVSYEAETRMDLVSNDLKKAQVRVHQ